MFSGPAWCDLGHRARTGGWDLWSPCFRSQTLKELSSEGLQRGGSTPSQRPGSLGIDSLQGGSCSYSMSLEGTLLVLMRGWQPKCVRVKAPELSGGAGSRRALQPCGEGSTEGWEWGPWSWERTTQCGWGVCGPQQQYLEPGIFVSIVFQIVDILSL